MIDHPDQLASVKAISQNSGNPPHIFIKIDASYGRAGVIPTSESYPQLVDAVLSAEKNGSCIFHGLYCHAGHSYGLREDWEAMKWLAAEFAELIKAAGRVRDKISQDHEPLVLSVGATPTTTSIQHPGLEFENGDLDGADETTREIVRLFEEAKGGGYKLEVHAGV